MTKLTTFILFVILIIMGIYAYNLYQTLPLDPKDLKIIFKQELPTSINASSELVQFVPNMRFNTNNISYGFQMDCGPERITSTTEAFNILSEKTQVLYFHEVRILSSPQIIIKCSEESKETESEDPTRKSFIAGEGGPTKFLELEPYSLILEGEIQLYSSKHIRKCSEPLVEIHELLHVLGYNHIDDKTSILYEFLSCDQELKQNIINDIRRLYSEPAKAELSIQNISASKAGSYLDFYIEIKNTGLISAEDVFLEVLADGKEVKTFEIQDLSPGMLRSLGIKNLRIPSRGASSIKFIVKSSTEEYFLQNNVVEMVVN
jgi:hypothetical protein